MVLHVPGSLAALGVCLSCYQAAVYDGQGLHGSLCFTWTVFDCVSAGGVVGPVSLSLFSLLQLLQELSYKTDFRKCAVNIWSLLHLSFGHKQVILKCCQHFSLRSPTDCIQMLIYLQIEFIRQHSHIQHDCTLCMKDVLVLLASRGW